MNLNDNLPLVFYAPMAKAASLVLVKKSDNLSLVSIAPFLLVCVLMPAHLTA
jgi:hypothetical protein